MSVAKRIIPCLDVDKGRVVKGVNFVDIIDAGDPIEIARAYDQEGADEITFLDITASHEGRKNIINVVESVANEVFIPLTVGGGVKNFIDVRNLLSAGADKITINTAAVMNPDLINQVTDKTGRQCIVVAIDAKKNGKSWEIFTHGGRNSTGINAIEFANKMENCGAGELLVTSMDKDGTLSGYDFELMKTISSNVNIPVIASGGVGTLDHLAEGIRSGASAVLAASIFHYGTYSVQEAKQYLASKDIPVRI